MGCVSHVCLHAQIQSGLAPKCLVRALSQVGHASPQGIYTQGVTLLADMNLSGSQEDMINDLQPTYFLVGDEVSGAKITAAPCLLALLVKPPTACLLGGL